MYEFQPTDKFYQKFASILCKDISILQPVCTNVVFLIAGFNREQLDLVPWYLFNYLIIKKFHFLFSSTLFLQSLLPVILAKIPAGSSVNQVIHYAQMIKSGKLYKKMCL